MAIIGIDLGTTNSLAAVWRNEKVEIIPNAHGDVLTPSVMSLDDNNQVIVGRPAKDRLVTHPDRSVACFKRLMGSDKKVVVNKRTFSPEELSALVLRQLKQDAEIYLGEQVEEAVISVPAYFNDNQRNATKVAAQLAGLKIERLINEPTAAALAYGIKDEAGEKTFIVIDLGGGTFDVSIMEKFENLLEVHATAGDSFFGGEDFTEKLVRVFCERYGADYNELSSVDKGRIYSQMDAVKRQLSVEERVEVVLQLHEREVPLSLSVDELNQQIEPLLQKLLKPIEQSIRDSSIKVGELDDVILVGGATRMPIIRQFVTRLFGRFPSCHLDPDHVVVMGAAIQAALKQRHEELDDVVLTDVCPFSMGIETVGGMDPGDRRGGIYSVILERNMVIPVSREERFFTVSDNQKVIDVRVFQGESRLVENNIELGNIEVKVPRKMAGEESVDVRFTYDINGLLEVIVKVVSTGKEESMVIQSSSSRMSESEIRKALKKLDKIKVHPRDKAVNQALMSRAERLFEERLGEERDSIGAVILGFEKVLQTQDDRKIDRYVEEMKQMLDSLEADMWQ